MSNEFERKITNIDEDSANLDWLLSRGWINESGFATPKYYNFGTMTPEELADFLSHMGGEESRIAAACYSESHVYQRTGPGRLTREERLHEKARALVQQNPPRSR